MPQNPQPVIEPASAADVETVVECWLELAAEQRSYESAIQVESNRETIRQILSAHRVTGGLLVARLDDEIVGFVTVTMESGTFDLDVTRGLLSNIWVEPSSRNRGIGTQLLEAAESTLADRGADVCRLEVMAANDGARRFYREHGFEPKRVTMDRSLTAREQSDTHSKADE